MSYALCTVPAAPVRREASHRSEMTNQLLFGEAVEVIDTQDEWLNVRSLYDGYEGWITHHLIEPTVEPVISSFVTSGLLNGVGWRNGTLHAPMGSFLPGFSETDPLLWDGTSTYGHSFRDSSVPDAGLLESTARLWLNAPYLWGGKTLMGVDCSGFVQTVFKVCGIHLLRDAYQQAEQGNRIGSTEQAQKGDLAFFHNDQGRVTHVGLMLSGEEIIHASGRVRIDQMDSEGIFNRETGRHTHRLHSVNRYEWPASPED